MALNFGQQYGWQRWSGLKRSPATGTAPLQVSLIRERTEAEQSAQQVVDHALLTGIF